MKNVPSTFSFPRPVHAKINKPSHGMNNDRQEEINSVKEKKKKNEARREKSNRTAYQQKQFGEEHTLHRESSANPNSSDVCSSLISGRPAGTGHQSQASQAVPDV